MTDMHEMIRIPTSYGESFVNAKRILAYEGTEDGGCKIYLDELGGISFLNSTAKVGWLENELRRALHNG